MRGAVLGIVAGVSSVGVARRVTAEQTGPPDVVMIEARVERLDDVECCFHANGVARLLRKRCFAWRAAV